MTEPNWAEIHEAVDRDELLPPSITSKLTPGELAEIDQLREETHSIGITAARTGGDPLEAVGDMIDTMLKMRNIAFRAIMRSDGGAA